MKQPKRILVLSPSEYRLMLHGLLHFRNKLIAQGRYPDAINELLVKRPAATFFVRVSGDSMIGAGIHDGDILVVDRSLRPASGDVIIASVDGEFTVKTYRRDRGGVRLEPANPAFPVIRIKSGQELDYFGKVTACIHHFA